MKIFSLLFTLFLVCPKIGVSQVTVFECPPIEYEFTDDNNENLRPDKGDENDRGGCEGCTVNAGSHLTLCLDEVNANGIQLMGQASCPGLFNTRWCYTRPPGAPALTFTPNANVLQPFVSGTFVPGNYYFTLYIICGNNNYISDYIKVTIVDPVITISNDQNLFNQNGVYYACDKVEFEATVESALQNIGNVYWYIDPAADLDFSYSVSGSKITVESKQQYSVCSKEVTLTATYYGPNGCEETKSIVVKFCASRDHPSGEETVSICIHGDCASEERSSGNDDCPENTYTFTSNQIPFAGCGRQTYFALVFTTASINPTISIEYHDAEHKSIKSVTVSNLCIGKYYRFRYYSDPADDMCPCDPVTKVFHLYTQETDLCYALPASQCLKYCETTPGTLSFSIPEPDNAAISWSINTYGQGSFGMQFTNPTSASTDLINVPDNVFFQVNATIVSPAGCAVSFVVATIWPENNLSVSPPFYLSCDFENYIFFREHVQSNYLLGNGDFITEGVAPNINMTIELIEKPAGFSSPIFDPGPVSYHPDLWFVPYKAGKYKFKISSNVTACGQPDCYSEQFLEFEVGPGITPVNAGTVYTTCGQQSVQLLGSHVSGSYTRTWTVLPAGPTFSNPNISNPVLSNLTPGTTYTVTYNVCSVGDCCASDEAKVITDPCDTCQISIEDYRVLPCDTATGEYSINLLLDYSNQPSGLIIVRIPTLAVYEQYNQGTVPQDILITNLVADGQSHTIYVYFNDEDSCITELTYQAPEPCQYCAPYSIGCFEGYVCVLDANGEPISEGDCYYLSANWLTMTNTFINTGQCIGLDQLAPYAEVQVVVFHTDPANTYETTLIFDVDSCEGNKMKLLDIKPYTNLSKAALSCFPNPNNGSFRMLNSSAEAYNYQIINNVGQMLAEGMAQPYENKEQMYDFAPGVYFIRYSTENNRKSGVVKIVVY